MKLCESYEVILTQKVFVAYDTDNGRLFHQNYRLWYEKGLVKWVLYSSSPSFCFGQWK